MGGKPDWSRREKMREEVETASITTFSSDSGITKIRNEAVAGRRYRVRRRSLFVKDGRYYSTFHIYLNKPEEKGKLMMSERGQLQEQSPCVGEEGKIQGTGGGWPWRGTGTVIEETLQQEGSRV